MRLTPLAWFCVFLGGLAVAATLITAMNIWVNAQNGRGVLASQPNTQVAAQARVIPTQSPAKYIIVARPTARPAVVAIAPKPSKDANANAANASAEGVTGVGYDTVTSDAASGSDVAANGKKGSAGNPIVANIQEYYKSIKQMPMGMYMAERTTLLPTYFFGNGLTTVKEGEAKRETYDYIKSGDVVVRVVSVKGQTAVVKIQQKGWVTDVYDVKTGEVKEADVKKDVIEQTMKVVYDPSDGRWKFAEGFAPVAAEASADAATAVATPAAKPATKKVVKPVKPVKPIATVVVVAAP
jgi:hypothetical protein